MYQAGISENSHSITRLNSDMTVYASMSMPAKTVAVLRLGGGHIFNRDFEFFQAEDLGANNVLRGFRKNRFSGRSLAYGSLEVRQKLFQSKWYVIPGDFGLVLFNDLGRVWQPTDEPNNVWHYAYGGGIYYVPYNMVIVSATIGFSKEEQLFNFSVGTKFNLTF
jgi:outer membrane translocation and assembly module TamA